MARNLLTLPCVAATYTFLMNTWKPLPESYQHTVYINTLGTVKRQIQQAENPMPAMLISMEAVCVANAILLDYLTSEVALEEPEIRSTDPNIPIDNNCIDDKLHFGLPVGSGEYEDEGDKSDKRVAIPTASQRWWAMTELVRFDQGTSAGDGYEGNHGDNAAEHEEEEASQADNQSTRNLDDWKYSTRECEDWAVHFRPVKYDNGDPNATAGDVSAAKTGL